MDVNYPRAKDPWASDFNTSSNDKMTIRKSKNRDLPEFKCLDCGKDTIVLTGDYYMVTDAIWDRYVPEIDGMLCLECLQKRMGRKITPSDISDCPLNDTNPFFTMVRNIDSFHNQQYSAKLI